MCRKHCSKTAVQRWFRATEAGVGPTILLLERRVPAGHFSAAGVAGAVRILHRSLFGENLEGLPGQEGVQVLDGALPQVILQVPVPGTHYIFVLYFFECL